MAMTLPKSGINSRIYLSGTQLSEANSWSIDVSNDRGEYLTFEDAAYSHLVGAYKATVQIDGYHEQDSKRMYDAAVAGVTVATLIYPDYNDTTTFLSFSASYDFSAGGAAAGADAITNSISGTVSGAITPTGFS